MIDEEDIIERVLEHFEITDTTQAQEQFLEDTAKEHLLMAKEDMIKPIVDDVIMEFRMKFKIPINK